MMNSILTLANTSSPEFTVHPDNIKIWVNNGNPITKPVIVRLSGSVKALKDVQLAMIRVVGKVECPECDNHGKDIPDTTFGKKPFDVSNTSITLDLGGMYYLYGSGDLNGGLFNPCDPVVITQTLVMPHQYTDVRG